MKQSLAKYRRDRSRASLDIVKSSDKLKEMTFAQRTPFWEEENREEGQSSDDGIVLHDVNRKGTRCGTGMDLNRLRKSSAGSQTKTPISRASRQLFSRSVHTLSTLMTKDGGTIPSPDKRRKRPKKRKPQRKSVVRERLRSQDQIVPP